MLQQLVNGMVPSAQGREILQLISGPERSKAVLDALAARALAPSAALQGVPSASSTVATPTPEPSYGAVSDGAPITGTSTTLPGVMNLGPGWDIYDSWKTPNQRVVEAERAAAQGGGATAATPQAGVDAQIADILRNLSSAQGNTPVNAPLDLSKALAQPTTAYSTNIPAGYNVSGAVTGGLANANAQTRSVQDLVNQLAGFQGTVGAPSLTPTGGGTAYGGANEAALRNQLAQTATQGGNIRDVVNAVVTSQPSTGIPALDAGMAQAKSAQPLANQLANFEGGVTGQTITDEQTLAAIDNLINTGAINTLSPAERNSLNTLRSNLTTSVMNGPKVPTAEAAQVGTQAVGNAQRLLDATGGPSPSRAGLAPALANAEARMGRPMTQSEIDSVANAYNYATSKWGKAAGDAMERIVAANAASNPQVAAQRDLLSGLQARASGQLSEAEMAALNRTADTTALDEASGRGRDDVLNAIIAEAMGQTSKSQMNAEAAMLDMAKVQANAQNSQLGELLAQRGMVGSGAGIGLAQDATNELLGNVVSQAQMQREANRQQALQNYQSYTGQLSNQSLAERQFALQDAMSRAGFSADQINAAMGQLNALTGQMAQQSAGQGQLTASLDEAARQRAQEASTTNAQLTQQTRQADLDRQMAERGRVSQDLLSTLGLAQQGALGAEQIAAGQRVAGTELLTGARTNEAQMQQQAQAQNMAAELQARGMSADLSMQIASQLMSAGNIEANLATRQAEL
ncbi:MAG: hypothetical protein KJ884_19215, partial [Gammaproteobacteria bacterium]|nr:hypothetical protein [Gammaproteobacteria bacterium]